MIRALVGRDVPHRHEKPGAPRTTEAVIEDRAILSFTLLLATLLSAFVISLVEAPPQFSFAEITSETH